MGAFHPVCLRASNLSLKQSYLETAMGSREEKVGGEIDLEKWGLALGNGVLATRYWWKGWKGMKDIGVIERD